jgi:hypothetical protein
MLASIWPRIFFTSIWYLRIQPHISVVYSPSREASSSSDNQQIPRIGWHSGFRCRTYKSPSSVPILSQINPVHAFPFQSLQIHFNSIPSSKPRPSKWYLLPLVYPPELVWTTCYMSKNIQRLEYTYIWRTTVLNVVLYGYITLSLTADPQEDHKLRILETRVSQSHPITGLDRPIGFQEVEAPRFQDNRHMKVLRLSALRTDRRCRPWIIPGAHFC